MPNDLPEPKLYVGPSLFVILAIVLIGAVIGAFLGAVLVLLTS